MRAARAVGIPRPATSHALGLAYFAALTSCSAALPGDCSAIEAGSYMIDPRTVVSISTQASCTPNAMDSAANYSQLLAACAAVHVPRVQAPLTRSPQQMAAEAECEAVPYPPNWQPGPGDYPNPCQFIRAVGVKQPDQTMITTKAAATALASPECAACAAHHEVAGGFAKCTVDADNSCAHSASLWESCFGSSSDLLRDQRYADAGQEYVWTGGPCLGWSSLGRCKLGTGDGEFPDLCQWDGPKPEGRRCTVKPEIMPVFTQIAHCNSLSYRYGHAPDSASVCSAIAPWCGYKIQSQGDSCKTDNNEVEAAAEAAIVGVPCDVALRATQPPPPDGGASIPTGAIITVVVVIVVAVLAGVGALMYRKRTSVAAGGDETMYTAIKT